MSNEEEIKPKYYRNHRLKQAKMQRQVRKTQRRLSRLRALYKFIILSGIILACIIIQII